MTARADRRCAIPDCTRPYQARGYCAAHYRRLWAGLPVDAPMRRKHSRHPEPCAVATCSRVRRWGDLCKLHATRKHAGLSDWDKPVVARRLGKPGTRLGAIDSELASRIARIARSRRVSPSLLIEAALRQAFPPPRKEEYP